MYLVIGRQNCPYCDKAKELLDSKELEYVYVDITSGDCILDSVWKHFLVDDMKVKTVPQVLKLIPGGYTGLKEELDD
jgi:glutaredoxin